MAYPIATTCTKCGATATLHRWETIDQISRKRGLLKGETAKLGFKFLICCPKCGIHIGTEQYKSN